jgi:hypothetical protein
MRWIHFQESISMADRQRNMFHQYVPTLVLRSTQSEPLSNLPPWKYCFRFIPDHVVDKTLSATMQMVDTVEAETREHMRDHLVSRLPELKVVHRVNDTACVHTFFSSIT